MEEKKPFVLLENTSDDKFELGVYYWLDTFDKSTSAIQVQNDLISTSIKKLFAAGIQTKSSNITLLSN